MKHDMKPIFKTDKNSVTSKHLNSDGSYSIAKVSDITSINIKDIDSKRQLLTYELMKNQPNEMVEQYFKFLKNKYVIDINYDVVQLSEAQ